MKKKDIALDKRIINEKDNIRIRGFELDEKEKGICIHLASKGLTPRLIVAELNDYRRLLSNQNPREYDFKPIPLSSFTHYLTKNREFSDELMYQEAKDDFLVSIERSLFALATGAETWEDKYIAVSDGNDNGAHLECTRTYKKERPDFAAIKFILTNYAPEKWQDKRTIDISGVEKLSDDELASMAEEFVKERKKKK